MLTVCRRHIAKPHLEIIRSYTGRMAYVADVADDELIDFQIQVDIISWEIFCEVNFAISMLTENPIFPLMSVIFFVFFRLCSVIV